MTNRPARVKAANWLSHLEFDWQSPARQLREFAVRAVERIPAGDDRVKYDHLFAPGDPENKAFWVRAIPAASDFVNTFTVIED